MRLGFRAAAAAMGTCAICLTVAPFASSSAMAPLPERTGLAVRGEGPVPGPPVVLLHGICGEPLNSCSVFADVTGGELVCARADLSCPNGGAMWSGGAGAIARIETAVRGAAVTTGGRVDPSAPRVLVGFSQGAYVAMRALHAQPHRYPAVLLIGAFVKPTRAELEAAGVVRIALAAGDFDGSSPTMRASAERLRAEGFDARFVSLGRVGHTYVADDPKKLADAVAWTEAAVHL